MDSPTSVTAGLVLFHAQGTDAGPSDDCEEIRQGKKGETQPTKGDHASDDPKQLNDREKRSHVGAEAQRRAATPQKTQGGQETHDSHDGLR